MLRREGKIEGGETDQPAAAGDITLAAFPAACNRGGAIAGANVNAHTDRQLWQVQVWPRPPILKTRRGEGGEVVT